MDQSKSQKAEISTASEAPVVSGIAAVRHYVAMRDKMPLLNLGGSVHAIHGGTEFGAELSFEDLKSLLASHDALVKALDTFLGGDDRFRVAVGGNPIAVDQMIADARATLLSARGVQ